MIWLPKKMLLLPTWGLGFAAPRMAGTGIPAMFAAGQPSHGEDCCCCFTCCEPGTSPPQLELDATGIVMNTFLGCGAGCAAFADVFLLDFRSVPTTTVHGSFVGACVWRYCGEAGCDDASYAFGWDVAIYSTGIFCRAIAIPWLGGDCDNFTPSGGTDATYAADLPTSPDDCCDALASPLSMSGSASGLSGSIVNKVPFAGGCEIFNIASNPISIQAVGC